MCLSSGASDKVNHDDDKIYAKENTLDNIFKEVIK